MLAPVICSNLRRVFRATRFAFLDSLKEVIHDVKWCEWLPPLTNSMCPSNMHYALWDRWVQCQSASRPARLATDSQVQLALWHPRGWLPPAVACRQCCAVAHPAELLVKLFIPCRPGLLAADHGRVLHQVGTAAERQQYAAMPCHATPCRAMPCHAMPCHAMSSERGAMV